ncbi:DUF2163 domain-containing protein [Novosphingobium sp. 9]|uniref:DUF2163 domain-containing protein n=1 Tax=Novosphingobium sp. 9 TaxID=2025349 RepID=UPI0021B68088|nr:DUF2163 domain-containing protein [Novosphingobium sp. 9]
MTRTWFSGDLETAATYLRILRRDGVTLGFTTHDRDLWLEGVLHRASPGMVPSSIRKSADLSDDSAEVEGALSHDSISSPDLAAGRFDDAQVRIGLVDWESGESALLYAGSLGTVSEEAGQFSAQLVSRKAELERDLVPRTSPTCRAAFCGPGCNLGAVRFTSERTLAAFDAEANAVTLFPAPDTGTHIGGTLRWIDGAQCDESAMIVAATAQGALVLDRPVDPPPAIGTRVMLRQGCDHTLETCAGRFGNAINFRAEPYLPGNDLLTRYPSPGAS